MCDRRRRKTMAAAILAGAIAVFGTGMLGGCKKAGEGQGTDVKQTAKEQQGKETGEKKEPKPAGKLHRYDIQFLDLFDTVTSVVGYTEDEETFRAYAQEFYDEMKTYHQLYDIYNDYEGIANIKTINDQAGVAPVQVDEKIIAMLKEAVDMNEKTSGYMNVAMGSVLSVWHEYRTEGSYDPEHAALPPEDVLKEAARHTDISQVEIDEAASTVFLPDPDMSLDVGSIAKGYATEMACRKLEEDGMTQALISVGGNVRAIGVKDDGSLWKVGIQNPDLQSNVRYLHTVELEDMSLVTSGSYQRFYTVDGVAYHHIIHPELLMPWNEYTSVSILCRDSGLADCLSTAVFNMEIGDGKELIESMEQVEAMWIFADGREEYSSGFKDYMGDTKE